MPCGSSSTPPTAPNWRAQQKGGASNAAGDELRIAVAGTTIITRQNTPVGKVVPADGAARFEDGDGDVLAVVLPHAGSKADSVWHHRILSPAGHDLGVLTLMTVHTGWNGIEAETTQWLLNENVGSLKAPSAGARLKIGAPVTPA